MIGLLVLLQTATCQFYRNACFMERVFLCSQDFSKSLRHLGRPIQAGRKRGRRGGLPRGCVLPQAEPGGYGQNLWR